ncbi:MAG: efflux RND transporter periplasmic adaptor subunit [bacterium]|nr:efflux RND transporter periplasmic adaptor subunit [bacterium]MCP5070191.1 efflux RND transporter periplasmic adaptor subunit [bacterium]
MKIRSKVIAPIAVLVAAVAVTGAMISARPEAQSQAPTAAPSPVRVVRVEASDIEFRVTAQGTVEPRTESELVTEVSGRLVWVSPELASGGFFAEGETLARIDPRDYQVARDGAAASLARARASHTHAEAGLHRQKKMRERGASSTALLDDAIHAAATAKAGVREAEVAVRRAELDLERCEIRVPFAGRVRDKHVDVGQFLNRGAPVARVYSTDYVEIRLPIHDKDLAYLELPVRFRAEGEATPSGEGPAVVISAEVAGRSFDWDARVVRTEGALDSNTRMTHVVARVEDPYRRTPGGKRPPLSIGLFVEASIAGRVERDVFEVPRRAVRRGDEVFVVDADMRLRFRRVDVLRSDRDHSWIRSGIEVGEQVVTSPLEVATEGMPVQIVGTPERRANHSMASETGP